MAAKKKKLLHPHAHHDRCQAPIEQWRVLDRNCNYSAFNGRQWTTSEYSACKCLKCRTVWRTKAAYVVLIKDATPAERLK